MHKDELIQLHSLLTQIRTKFANGIDPQEFGDYDKYGVRPQHIHRSKFEHKRAVFLLAKGLTVIGAPHEGNGVHHQQGAFQRLAKRATDQPSLVNE